MVGGCSLCFPLAAIAQIADHLFVLWQVVNVLPFQRVRRRVGDLDRVSDLIEDDLELFFVVRCFWELPCDQQPPQDFWRKA